MKFSIVIPTYNRRAELYRALRSVANQAVGGWECIVVDDASRPGFEAQPVVQWMQDSRFRLIRLAEHSERVIATNAGLDAAQGEWLCLLDSDDEYAVHYLEAVSGLMADHPEARCFNFGAVVHWRYRKDDEIRYSRTTLRPVFQPRWLGESHEEFKSGGIGNGSFVFHREVWGNIERLPEAKNCYDLHRMATDVHHLYPVDENDPHGGQTLGNPWGQDWLLFHRITRKYRSIPSDVCLYVQHVRV